MNKLEPIGNIDFTKKIHIYGAGIAGLLIGYYLKKKNLDFTIYEKSDRVGGKIQGKVTDNGVVEFAANAIYTNNDVRDLIAELNLKPIYAKDKLKKVVYRNQKPMSPPITIIEIFKLVCNGLKKIKLTKPFVEYSAKEFFTPFLGKNLVDHLMSAVYRGIYSIEADEIHAASLYPEPKLGERYLFYFIRAMKERKKGQKEKQQSVSFENGMQDFINALAEKISSHIQLNKSPEIHENSIICTESFSASKLLENMNQSIAQELNKIEYTKLTTTTLFTRNEISFLKDSFGILLPSRSKKKTMGILANHNIFPDRKLKNQTFSYTFISEINETIETQLADLNLNIKSIEEFQTSWEKAIPKYNFQRYQVVKKCKELLINKNLMLFGNYTNGISIREMVSFAKNFYSSN